MARDSTGGSGRWPGAPLARRDLLRGTGAALGLGLLGADRHGVAAHAESDPAADPFAGVELPPELGQTELQVYVAATGHTLRGSMLDYWRATGGAAVYGNPISEPFAAPNGYYSQAFANAVLQYRPEFLWTEEPIVRLLPLGRSARRQRPAVSWPRDRWWAGASGPGAAERRLDPTEETVARVIEAGGRFVEATGYTIGPDILPWYTMNEGRFYLGDPLSQPLPARGTTAQWFEGGLLLIAPGGPRLAPLGAELAPRLGIDTAPVPRGDLPAYDEALFSTGDNPYPIGDPAAPGMRWVEVSVTEQRLWAYQGDTLVMTTLVSTGREPNPTELGIFHVRLKYPVQDLSGFISDTGEVVGFGDEAPPGTIPYTVEDVPHVMYFNLDGEALHGTYWHDMFGMPMSYGCVNLPLDVAAWMYGWAPLGTEVWVHE